MQLSVQAYIESAQSWSELEFGLASATQIDSTPVYSEYNYVTLFIDADNQGIGPQIWDYYRTGQGAAANGSTTQVNGASLTSLFDGWHTFTFTFTETQSIEIAIDGVAFNASPDNWYDAATDEFSIYLGEGRMELRRTCMIRLSSPLSRNHPRHCSWGSPLGA